MAREKQYKCKIIAGYQNKKGDNLSLESNILTLRIPALTYELTENYMLEEYYSEWVDGIRLIHFKVYTHKEKECQKALDELVESLTDQNIQYENPYYGEFDRGYLENKEDYFKVTGRDLEEDKKNGELTWAGYYPDNWNHSKE